MCFGGPGPGPGLHGTLHSTLFRWPWISWAQLNAMFSYHHDADDNDDDSDDDDDDADDVDDDDENDVDDNDNTCGLHLHQ